MHEDLLYQAAEGDPADHQDVRQRMKHTKTGYFTGLLLKHYCSAILRNYTKRSTLPERRQRVHTYFLTGAPFSTTLTLWTLGAHFLLEIL